jgi:hypothetical protein
VLTGADDRYFERQRAIERLAARGDPRLIEPLLALVRDRTAHLSVRAAAARAVARAGVEGALAAVRGAQAELKEGSPLLWRDLMAARGSLGDVEAFHDLVALHVETRSAGLLVLVERGGGGGPAHPRHLRGHQQPLPREGDHQRADAAVHGAGKVPAPPELFAEYGEVLEGFAQPAPPPLRPE